MSQKKYKVTLTPEEKTFLLELISKGKIAAKKLSHPTFRTHLRNKSLDTALLNNQ